jgi:hypothetical protein
MKTLNFYTLFLLLTMTGLFAGCRKQDEFLDAKPNQALAVPRTLDDLELLLRNQSVFNQYYPSLGELSSDDIEISTAFYNTLSALERNTYTWSPVIYNAGANVTDWSAPYQQVYYANTILENLARMDVNPANEIKANKIKGSALFYRSMAFFNLLQVFTMPYTAENAATTPGIPLRLSADLNHKVARSPEKDCYEQVLLDLGTAATLLPDMPDYKTEASRAAVYGLLTRIHLVMGNYPMALENASLCLKIYPTLQDLNKLNPNAFPVYPDFSPEEIFHSALAGYVSLGFNTTVSPSIYQSFTSKDDLRPSIFFYPNKGAVNFNSQFDKKNNVYAGISTNEIYLTRAECFSRGGQANEAIADLNTVLAKRWKSGTYKLIQVTNADDALRLILDERKRELLFTGLRWLDLRRLNLDPKFAVTLRREIGGVSYTLPPNDLRYALPIPDNEIQLNGIPQNAR